MTEVRFEHILEKAYVDVAASVEKAKKVLETNQ